MDDRLRTLPNYQRAQWMIIVVCSALALILRLYYVNVAVVDHPIRGDATSYYAYAWNLLHNGVFSHVFPGDGPPVADSYRDPAYPFLMAAIMRLSTGDAWYQAMLDVQALLGAATVFLALVLGRRWLSWPWLAGAGVLMAIWPHSITSASYLLTETLTGFWVALGILLASLPAARRWTAALAAGLVLGAAALTNAILLPFGALLAGFLVLFRLLPRTAAVALLLGSLLLPGIWAVRNATLPAAVYATTATSTGRAIQNFVQGSWPEYHNAWRQSQGGDAGAAEVMKRIKVEIDATVSNPSQGLRAIGQRLAADPWHSLGWYLGKPALLWGWSIRMGAGDVFIYPVTESPYFFSASFVLMAAFAHALNPWVFVCAAGFCFLVALRRARRWPGASACALLLLYVTVVYWLLQSEPRYSIPYRSQQLLAAITMLSWVWEHLLNWRRDRNAQSVTAVRKGRDLMLSVPEE